MGKPDLTNYDAYYREKLEEGLRFEDYVADVLYESGIVLNPYASKVRGAKAENRFGLEIKRDGKFRQTNNLYIETDEKSHPSIAQFTPSGIHRDDTSWLYLIGDEQTMWIFAKLFLRSVERGEFRWNDGKIPVAERRLKRTATATSKGFLLPLAIADAWCVRKVTGRRPRAVK